MRAPFPTAPAPANPIFHGDEYGPRVDEDTFWALIAQCRRESGSDSDLAARLIFRRLRVLDGAAVVEFGRLWERAKSRLHSWPVTDAVCLVLGPVEGEDLGLIQDWIVSYGRSAVERIVHDPDNLADLAADGGSARADGFQEFLAEAHIVVSGTWPLGYDPDGPEELTGEHTDLRDRDAVGRRFPRLTAFRRDHPELGEPDLG
jgi:uncharacterized protein DUF4240